jgi:hypothetical protein
MKVPILVEPGMQPETCDQILDAVAEVADKIGIFKRGNILCELHVVEKDQAKGRVRRPRGATLIKPCTSASLCRIFPKAVVFSKFDARKNAEKVIDMQRGLAEAILSMPDWPQIPELRAVVEAPILDLDGREYSEPGYHPEIQIYIATAGKLKPAPGVAGRARGTAGVKRLLHLLRGFPFKSPSDKSAALAAIITALLRRLLPAAPLFAVSAPTAGTGKSLLAEVIGIIVTGRKPPMLSMGDDEAELEKRIGMVLLEGDPLIVIDNVTRPFGNEPIMNQLSTQEILKVRILGFSTSANVPTSAMVLVTGNNLAIVGDLKRRTALIQLDAGVERPEQRTIDFDALVEAQKDRDVLIRAALDIVKSYLDAGGPPVMVKTADGQEQAIKPVGSFGDWDRMVRRPLIWLGQADPLESAEVLREADPDMEAMSSLFTAWRDRYQDEAQTAALVVQDAIAYGATRHDYPELHEGVSLACSGKIDVRRLGYWLRAHKDRLCDGMQLIHAGREGHSKMTRWKVVRA